MSGGSSTPATLIRDEDGNFVGLVLDGAVYRIQTETKITGTVPVSGPLTNTELRAAAVPVSNASLPLPSGAATETTLAALNVNAGDIETILTAIRDSAGVKKITDALPAGTNNIGDVDVVSSVLPTGAATEATLSALNTNAGDIETILTAIRDTAGVKKITDALPAGTNNIGDVDIVSSVLPTGAATETTLASINTKTLAAGQAAMTASSPVVIASDQSAVASKNAAASQVDGHSASIGATTDADTALTVIGRIKQLLTRLPAALVGGRLDSNIGAWLGSTTPTVGQKTLAASIPAGIASDQWPDALARAIFSKVTDGTNTMPTGDAIIRAIFHQLTDGTNGPVAVKAASTAPVAADKALVCVLSPNQPAIPVTTSPLSSTPNLAFGDVVIAATTLTAIRRTAYTEQTANFTGSIVSSSANDTAAGTGARTVLITWMNAAGTTVGAETVTLNGTTAVNLVTATKCFIEHIEVLTAGSTGSNVGILTLWTGAGATGVTVGTIAATNNRTFWAHHYVQSGKTANITGILHGSSTSVAGGTSSAYLVAKAIGVANAIDVQVSDTLQKGGATNLVFRSYGSQIQVAGPTRLLMYCLPGAVASNTYTGSFDSYDS